MLQVKYYNKFSILQSMAESMVIGGFPMVSNLHQYDIDKEIDNLYLNLVLGMKEGKNLDDNIHIKRAKRLANTRAGEGHNSFLKGIQFNVVVDAPLYWLKQYQRYHFTDIISSQSTMHRITSMDLRLQSTSAVNDVVISLLNVYIDMYKEALENKEPKEVVQDIYDKIIANAPSGLCLTMGITINYLQLVSMYNQRKNHKLKEWKQFCVWVEELPYADILITGKGLTK